MAITLIGSPVAARSDNDDGTISITLGTSVNAHDDVFISGAMFATGTGGYISAVSLNGKACTQVGGNSSSALPSGNGSTTGWLCKDTPAGTSLVLTVTGSSSGNYFWGAAVSAQYLSATVVAAVTSSNTNGLTPKTITVTSPGAVVGDFVACAFHGSNQGLNSAGSGQTYLWNSGTDATGEEGGGVYKIATSTGDQSLSLDLLTNANIDYSMFVITEGAAPGGGGAFLAEADWQPLEPQTNPLVVSVW